MSSVLIIYTGGTIGMMENPQTGALEPVDFKLLDKHIPEVGQFDFDIAFQSFDKPMDSSDISPADWVTMVDIIEEHYNAHDGFVILHGTDTLAYTASALSYMLQNLRKPVILTGAQLPIGKLRTDGKENLVTSIEIAAARTSKGDPVIQEVAICFEDRLLRGNRSHKHSTEDFEAFQSYNYPNLANIGMHIQYNKNALLRAPGDLNFRVRREVDSSVALITVHPGMSQAYVQALLDSNVRAVIVEAYGSGNSSKSDWLREGLNRFTQQGGILVCVTQCQNGFVELGRYKASATLVEAGAVSAGDMTTEAVLTKLMCLLGRSEDNAWVRDTFAKPMAGDMTTYSERL